MHHKIIETIKENQMIDPGDKIIVGFSGGADSVTLLAFLWEVRKELSVQVTACHVNHSLRGEESDRDELFCRNFCSHRGIPFQAHKIDAATGAKQEGLSVELYARQERYRVFDEAAEQLDNKTPVKIATAHTLSDKAETIIFHMARGTGLKGLEGIPAVRGNIIRPLIDCTRKEVEDYCYTHSLIFMTDSSNLTDEYTRNRIRHRIVPEMLAINPAFAQSIRRLSQSARRDNTYLAELAQQAYDSISQNNTEQISARALLELDPALGDRVTAMILEQAGAEVSIKKMQDVLQLAKEGSGTMELVRGVYISCENGLLRLKREAETKDYFEVPLFPESVKPESAISWEIRVFDGKIVNILLCDYENYKKFQKKWPDVLKKSVDYDRIENVAVMRQRKEGDSILLYHKAHGRTLKKLFIEAKIPAEERGSKIVLSDSTGPVWVEGFGCDKRVEPSADSRKILILNIQ